MKFVSLALLAVGLIAAMAFSGCAQTQGQADLQKALDFCGKFGNDQSQHSCFIGIAVSQNDASICEKHAGQDFQDICHTQMAAFLKDITHCEEIIDENVKETCYYNTAKSVSNCRKIADIEIKESCLHSLAIKEKDSKICEFIISQIHHEKCVQDLASGIAVHN